MQVACYHRILEPVDLTRWAVVEVEDSDIVEVIENPCEQCGARTYPLPYGPPRHGVDLWFRSFGKPRCLVALDRSWDYCARLFQLVVLKPVVGVFKMKMTRPDQKSSAL